MYAQQTGEELPSDPMVQLRRTIAAVFDAWRSDAAVTYRNRGGIDHGTGVAVVVQAMVFGNRDDRSGTGVAYSHHPATGERRPTGDFLARAQGDDVVRGEHDRRPVTADGQTSAHAVGGLGALEALEPQAHAELLDVLTLVGRHHRDMCDVEFTVESGRLWVLRAGPARRTGAAALRVAVELVEDPEVRLTRTEAVGRIRAEHVEQVLHPSFEPSGHDVLTCGLGASPGAAVGAVVLTADAAVAAAAAGRPVILVRAETTPEDVHGMSVAAGILTSRGGLASHAAVVARGWGTPAVCGAEQIRFVPGGFAVGPVTVTEGDVISIDGSSGEVMVGAVTTAAVEPPAELDVVLGWADEIRAGHLAVRANADTAADATRAREFGAEGIGLCRTEHMFLGEDRLPVVRQMILATTPGGGADGDGQSCGWCSGRTSSPCWPPWTGSPSRCGCSIPRCTSSSPTWSSSRSGQRTGRARRRRAAAARRRPAMVGDEPDDRHPGRAARLPEAGPVPDAGPRARGGGRRAARRRAGTRSWRS